MNALKIARACFAILALGLAGLGLIRLTQDVTNAEGGVCDAAWSMEYEGPCDSALKARQVEVATEWALAAGVVVIVRRQLRAAA